MTCIIAMIKNNNAIIAADRGASDTNIILPLATSKIWQKNKYLFGYYGGMEGELVKDNFTPPEMPKTDIDVFMRGTFLLKLKDFYEQSGINKDTSELGLIVIAGNYIYEHNITDMSMSRYETDYLACGSGSEYAFGSLYSTSTYKDSIKRVKIALEAAIKYSPSCLGPIDILERK
jgi:20S proteasome alpha/beta subunit